jgi:hypothetical protein
MQSGFSALFASSLLLPTIGSARIGGGGGGAHSAGASSKTTARPNANELIDLERDDNSENSVL